MYNKAKGAEGCGLWARLFPELSFVAISSTAKGLEK